MFTLAFLSLLLCLAPFARAQSSCPIDPTLLDLSGLAEACDVEREDLCTSCICYLTNVLTDAGYDTSELDLDACAAQNLTCCSKTARRWRRSFEYRRVLGMRSIVRREPLRRRARRPYRRNGYEAVRTSRKRSVESVNRKNPPARALGKRLASRSGQFSPPAH